MLRWENVADLSLVSGAKLFHRERTQAASLVVCSKYKEMYGRILKSLTIVNLYRGMPKLKRKMNVTIPQLLCLIVSKWRIWAISWVLQ